MLPIFGFFEFHGFSMLFPWFSSPKSTYLQMGIPLGVPTRSCRFWDRHRDSPGRANPVPAAWKSPGNTSATPEVTMKSHYINPIKSHIIPYKSHEIAMKSPWARPAMVDDMQLVSCTGSPGDDRKGLSHQWKRTAHIMHIITYTHMYIYI